MIIDAHAHISPTKDPLPTDFADAATEYLLTAGVKVTHYGIDEDLVNGLKAAGVEKAIVMPIANSNIEKAARLNDHVKVSSLGYPCLEAFASVNPKSRRSEEEADRVLREKGLRGLVVDPSMRFDFTCSEFWRILELTKTNRAAIFVHSEYTDDSKFFGSDEINETLVSFPEVKFIFSLAKRVGYIIPEPNAYFETAHASREELAKAIETYGADKLMYGSDFKYNFYPKGELERLNLLGVPLEDKAKIMGGNAARILRLPGGRKVNLPEKLGFLKKFLGR